MDRPLVSAGPRRAFLPRAALAVIGSLVAAAPLGAQLVTPRTIPVLQDAQFDIFPSARAGMAGLSIAVDDTLADPFVNPAKATRVRGGAAFGSPFRHSITGNRGGGMTLPLGAVGSAGDWSLGGVVALQQLDRAGPMRWGAPTSDRTAINRYGSVVLARRLGDGLSVGANAYRASLGAVDGVDLLYAGSDRIAQEGSLTDLRLGLTKQWRAGGNAEVMLLHSRTSMTHDVHFAPWTTWDPSGRQQTTTPERSEHNVDRTRIWGVHAEASRPVGSLGWRIGTLATANVLSHPKIPNYAIMNIPRDPGTTWAYNLGVGAARTLEQGGTAGIDIVYEPMWSTTWADAASDTTGPTGVVVPRGARTVDNRFRFSNLKVRLGLARERELTAERPAAWGYQLGLALTAIDYRLRQANHVARVARTQDEHWMEWTPTFALRYRSRAFVLAYDFRITCGPGGDCLPVATGDDVTVVAPTPGGVIAAPSRPLDFSSGAAITNRFTVSVPLR
jgi:hypothetical protein